MTQPPSDEPIRVAVTVPVPADQAFPAFADLATWWPREYTWAADTLEDIGIDPREGGFCFERGPHGFTCHWGRVLTWDPPARRAGRSSSPATPPACPDRHRCKLDQQLASVAERQTRRV